MAKDGQVIQMTAIRSPIEPGPDNAPILRTSPSFEHSAALAAGHGGFSGASIWSGVANLSTSIIGAGIMGLPATMKVLGLPLGVLVLLGMALLTELSLEFLVRTTTIQQAWSYSNLVHQEFGNVSRLVLDVSVVFNNLGICTVYLIIIADVLSGTYSGNGAFHTGLLVQWNGGHSAWWTSRYIVILVTMIVFILPLTWLKHVDSLQYTSVLSVALALIFVVITVIIAIIGLAEGKLPSPSFVPDLRNTSGVIAIFNVIPVMATAFICHFNVHPIYVELKDRSEGTMLRICRNSLVLCTSVYLVTAISGYLLFGADTAADVLVNFDHNLPFISSQAVFDIVRVSYVLHIILVFPVIFYPLRNVTDDLAFPHAAKGLAEDTLRFSGLTLGYLTLVYILAVLVPNIWMAFDITGATTTMAVGLVFPALLALRDKSGVITAWEHKVSYFMLGLAVVVSITGLTSSIYYIAHSQSGQPGSEQQNGITGGV